MFILDESANIYQVIVCYGDDVQGGAGKPSAPRTCDKQEFKSIIPDNILDLESGFHIRRVNVERFKHLPIVCTKFHIGSNLRREYYGIAVRPLKVVLLRLAVITVSEGQQRQHQKECQCRFHLVLYPNVTPQARPLGRRLQEVVGLWNPLSCWRTCVEASSPILRERPRLQCQPHQ